MSIKLSTLAFSSTLEIAFTAYKIGIVQLLCYCSSCLISCTFIDHRPHTQNTLTVGRWHPDHSQLCVTIFSIIKLFLVALSYSSLLETFFSKTYWKTPSKCGGEWGMKSIVLTFRRSGCICQSILTSDLRPPRLLVGLYAIYIFPANQLRARLPNHIRRFMF